MDSKDRCPGNELNKSLSVLSCKCDACAKVNEIFADEVNKTIKCSACGAVLDTSKCAKV